MIELLLMPLLAGLGIAVLAGPYGCLLVWRRMAFFGDTLAHAALPGVALGLWLSLDITLTVVGFCMLVVVVLLLLERSSRVPVDTLLAVVAHSSLALGLLAVAMMSRRGPGLETFLLGDLLAVGPADLLWIGAAVVLLGGLLLAHWQDWLRLIVHEELAGIDGLPVARLRLLQLVATAVLVALAMRAVGVLLVSALLIVPAAASRRLAASPETMAVLASLSACLCTILGLAASWYWDTPAGPSVIVCASLLYLIVHCLPARPA